VSWRWCFYINLSTGGAATLTMILAFYSLSRKLENGLALDRIEKVNLVGAALFILSIVMILLTL
ncbi:uncharacterized protein A1O5_03657, partial [Cladophialophora psammophila CBS 110553]